MGRVACKEPPFRSGSSRYLTESYTLPINSTTLNARSAVSGPTDNRGIACPPDRANCSGWLLASMKALVRALGVRLAFV